MAKKNISTDQIWKTLTNAGLDTLGLPNISNNADNKDKTTIPVGDKIGIYGDLFSSLLNLGVTLSSKNNSPNINPFADYAKRALDKYQEINSSIDKVRTLAKENEILAENTQMEKNRLGARGINTNRALDLATYASGLEVNRKIDSNYYNRTAAVAGKEAQIMLNQDGTVMSAEERKQNRDQSNADNYLSNVSSNISDLGVTAESIGKTINQETTNNIAAHTALSGQYGSPQDYLNKFGLSKYIDMLGFKLVKK